MENNIISRYIGRVQKEFTDRMWDAAMANNQQEFDDLVEQLNDAIGEYGVCEYQEGRASADTL